MTAARLEVAVTTGAGNGFGVDNLPFGVARFPDGRVGCVSALGDDVVDLAALERSGLLRVPGLEPGVLGDGALNRFLDCGRPVWSEVRARLAELVASGHEGLAGALVALGRVSLLEPVAVGDFLDFNASLHHATAMGRLFRPGSDPVPPHWRRMPLGYTGRASSVVVSGTPVRRPLGQVPVDGSSALRPTAELDLEAEVGAVVGTGSPLGDAVPAAAAADHLAGLVLVNDWSARDVQAHESQPLGPFLGKSFATSVSPWLVTLDALSGFRVRAPAQDPPPAGYLATSGDWAFDLRIEVAVQTAAMRAAGLAPATVSRSSLAYMYWTLPQLLAHATVNGAPLRTGDLLGSGTVSGPEPGSEGCLMELTLGGQRPFTLPDGSTRTFLEDGDTVVIRGWAGGEGRPLVSLGEVAGTVLPARPQEV